MVHGIFCYLIQSTGEYGKKKIKNEREKAEKYVRTMHGDDQKFGARYFPIETKKRNEKKMEIYLGNSQIPSFEFEVKFLKYCEKLLN